MSSRLRPMLPLVSCVAFFLCLLAAGPCSGSEATAVDFARDIRPILSNQCFKCHGPDEESREADLRLDKADDAYLDRGGYQAIKPGDPESSSLLARIDSTDPDLQMPPPDSGLELTDRQKDLLRRWIQDGAPYSQHWAFRPIVRPPLPDPDSVTHPIDQFIHRRLRGAGLEPSSQASSETLVRRLYLDVTGLPPDLEVVDQFLNDKTDDAWEQLVDRALQSPHYGEKWARHWLDQARYADSNGYTIDSPRSMWPWRDWVIKAINDDMPFDQFTIEQLAGDLLPSPTRDQLVATGFHRNTLINQEGGTDDEQFRVETVVDRVNTTGAVWLGLTVGCAQCHTHKYDPLTQHEYYQLFAFFNNGQDVNSTNPVIRVPDEAQAAKLAELGEHATAAKQALVAFDDEVPSEVLTAEQQEMRKQLEAARKKALEAKNNFAKSITTTMVMRERSEPRASHVLIRGDFLRLGDPVQAGGPTFLHAMPELDGEARSRLDLAKWLVSPDNVLTARVIVNRIWMRLFGRGLVETENDFGLQGTPPTHPELLDWLAVEFMQNGWSRRQLIRQIVTSATYRQSSRVREDIARIDPLNQLLGRQARIRVDAEIVRDLTLAASGLLNRKIGGPSVYPPQPDGVYAFTQRAAKWPTSTGGDRYRRGMYTFFFRSAPHPMLTTFDAPFFNTTCTRRVRSNTPLQSLTMANDEALVEAAQAMAGRLLKAADNDDERIELAWRVCFSRYPDDQERDRVKEFLSSTQKSLADASDQARAIANSSDGDEQLVSRAAWTIAARALLNLDEFITRE